jgi:MoaA/NifB/PqqE/SkfB family radical SAM enzyme
MLTQVRNNIDNNTLMVDLSIGNICNYQCWYCFEGAHEGNHKWFDYEVLLANTKHLFDWYIANGKTKFDIHFVGGEPTHWPKLLDYIKYLKENYNCLISMTSNGSKKIQLWKNLSKYFDKVQLSFHHQQADIDTFIKVADLLYENKVIVSTSVMMDPIHWNRCMYAIQKMKYSKHRWTIRYAEILSKHEYTNEQKTILKKHKARSANWLWFLRNNRYKPTKIYVNHKKVKDNYLLVNKLNKFKGWRCNLGVDWIHINPAGTLTGTCGQTLYNDTRKYNFRDPGFTQMFNPKLLPVICEKECCLCMPETNITKCKE